VPGRPKTRPGLAAAGQAVWPEAAPYRPLGNGVTSSTFLSKNNRVVIKRVENPKYRSNSLFEREVFWLKRLNELRFPWVPKFLAAKKPYVAMEFRGHRVTKTTLPPDWAKQAKQIDADLKRANCRHNDIKLVEILVLNGQLSLVDYGWASLGADMSLGKRYSAAKFPGHFSNSVYRVLANWTR